MGIHNDDINILYQAPPVCDCRRTHFPDHFHYVPESENKLVAVTLTWIHTQNGLDKIHPLIVIRYTNIFSTSC